MERAACGWEMRSVICGVREIKGSGVVMGIG
jgi:hypothetical protein